MESKDITTLKKPQKDKFISKVQTQTSTKEKSNDLPPSSNDPVIKIIENNCLPQKQDDIPKITPKLIKADIEEEKKITKVI